MNIKTLHDYFKTDSNIYLVTSNSYLSAGKLMMGAGASGELNKRVPGIDRYFGIKVAATCGHLGKYGVILTPLNALPSFGIFQVRYRHSTPIDLELLAYSTTTLRDLAEGILNNYQIALNYPGDPSDTIIYSILEHLPDNVTLYIR